MDKIKTKFNVSFLFMLEYCKTMLAHFLDEQANFEAFDVAFATPFETDWQDAIDAAEDILPDEAVQDQLQQLTADVEAAMEASRQKFAATRYFIEKAFPDKPAVQKEFGVDDYRDVRKSQKGMTQFMQTLFKTATKYAAQLAAVNYDAAAVAEIQTLGNALNDANIAQEKFKGTRVVTTEERVVAHNAAWDVMVQVSKAGKIIFRNDPAKYQLFLLPASSETGEDISISGTVTDGTDPIEGATVSIGSLSIDVTTDSNGSYAFGNLSDGSYDLDFSADGYVPQTVSGVQVVAGETADVDVQLVAIGGAVSISGTVRDAVTTDPVASATVRLINSEGTLETTTDASGDYLLEIPSLSGTVSADLEVIKTSYVIQSRPLTLHGGDTLTEDFNLSLIV